MKLTNKDKNYLLSLGYTNEDFTAIEDVTKNIKYELFFTKYALISISAYPKIKLNQKQVIGMLGRETFLSGIGRTTFHSSAVRYSKVLPNIAIYFERKKF
jgi:hypothetical protein